MDGLSKTTERLIRNSVFLFKTERFGDWIQSPSSGKAYLVRPN
jgi:hypothetical protein